LRLQVSQPGEDMRFALQLIERANLRMFGTQPSQELAYCAAIMANRVGVKGSTKRVDSLLEVLRQRMFDWGAEHVVHDVVTGRGRMC
jgi:hypothetical protein